MDNKKALEWITDALGVQGRVVTLDDTPDSVADWVRSVMLSLLRLEEDHKIILSADETRAIKSIKEVCQLWEKAQRVSFWLIVSSISKPANAL